MTGITVPISIGDHVRDGLGHVYRVVEHVNGYAWKVQPLTPVGTTLQPFGKMVTMGRSEMRADGE